MLEKTKVRVDAFLLLAVIPLLDFVLRIGPPEPWGVPLLTSLVVLAILAFSNGGEAQKHFPLILMMTVVGTIGYMAASYEFIGELAHENGKKERVVTGYSLRPELQNAIHEAIEDEAQRRDAQLAASGIRDSSAVAPAKTEDEIREQMIDAVVSQTGNAAAPYTRVSRMMVTLGLLALWELTFAGLAMLTSVIRVTLARVPRTDP